MQRYIQLLKFWVGGIRFYIGLATILASLEVWWWAHTLFGGSKLEVIRTQEVFGWASIILLVATLLVGPFLKLFPNIRAKAQLRESRRALGISAAWFGLLHTLVAYFKQFQATNPAQLPASYQQSMLLGLIGLIILAALAATSVNAIMRSWGVWWFRLHRLVYLALVVVLLHAFMIGAHAVSNAALLALAGLALLWISLNLVILARQPEVKLGRVLSIGLSIIVLAGVLTYGLNQHFEQARAAAALQGHGH